MIIWVQILMIVGQEDASALTTSFGLDNVVRPAVGVFVGERILEFTKLRRKNISPWKEFVLLIKLFLHFDQVPCQMIFTRELEHARKVVDLLIWFHLGYSLRKNTLVSPEDVPVFIASFHLIVIIHFFNTLVLIT